ncbi:MAG: M42 family metallopeptidase [Oscillospiraceae bacterium]|jgi:putative aminopeptidase FrvX|nr:M42 family metallopeptidase [Oscillospiraceae bacterium]
MEEILRALCGVGAPSGFERPAVLAARELLEPLVDEIWIDRLGSLVGVRRCGKPGAKKLLLDAHLDEVGLVVTGIKDGFLRFKANGVDVRMLPDREVTILTQPPILGVVACLPPHVLSAEEREKAPEIKDLYVDTGLSQEEAERRIPVGTPMVYRTDFTVLGERQLCAKAMDDRACFAALLRTAELLRDQELDMDLYIVGSVCEETGGVGARVLAQGLSPDFCVAVDVTHGKTPDSPKEGAFVMGSGPVVGIGPNMARWMVRRLLDEAEKLGLAVQKEVMEGSSGTNGWELQIANEGIATAVLSVPLKYMHTPVEVVEPGDIEATARLLAAFAEHLGGEEAVL